MSQPHDPHSIPSLLAQQKQEFRSRSLPSEAKPSIQRAVRHLHEHLFDPQLTVDRLLLECAIGSNTFSQRFRMRMGHTPHEYIQHRRIEVARALLNQGVENLFLISMSVGYARYRTFLRNFKAIVGCTPSEYLAADQGTNA